MIRDGHVIVYHQTPGDRAARRRVAARGSYSSLPIDANLPFTEVTTALFLKNCAEVRLIYDAGMDNRNTGTTEIEAAVARRAWPGRFAPIGSRCGQPAIEDVFSR